MAGPEMSWDEMAVSPPIVPISTSSNGSHTHYRLQRIEQKVHGMEHYVSGRGWTVRLVAWVTMALVVAAGFAIQQHRIDQLHRNTVPAKQEQNRP